MNPATTHQFLTSEAVEAITRALLSASMHPWEDVSVGCSRGKIHCCWIEDAHHVMALDAEHERMMHARFP
jgi:hypothetical protein